MLTRWLQHVPTRFLAIFPLKFPLKSKKFTDSGRNGRRTKTKTVMKSVNKMEHFETLQKLKKSNFQNKNHPTVTHPITSAEFIFMYMFINVHMQIFMQTCRCLCTHVDDYVHMQMFMNTCTYMKMSCTFENDFFRLCVECV